MVELKLCYHGTNEENAAKILREGFLPRTHFGEHLEDAVGYGGPYIFEVVFPDNTTSEAYWQFTTREHLPPTRIRRHYKFTKEVLYEDNELGKRIFASGMPDIEEGREYAEWIKTKEGQDFLERVLII